MEVFKAFMLRVAYVSTYPPTHCGVAEYTRMLATAVRSIAPSTKVYVLCNVGGCVEGFDEEVGAPVYPAFRRRSTSYSEILNVLAGVGGVDVLHVQHEYGIYGYGGGLLKAVTEARDEGLARKVVFTMHTIHHPLSRRSEALGFQRGLNVADAVVVHSYLQEFEIQHQGVNPLKIYRIPHGTLINPYSGTPRFKLLRELGLEGVKVKGFIMAIPGFIRRDKGLDILAEALRGLGEVPLTVITAGEVRDAEVLEVLEGIKGLANLVLLDRYLSNEEILKLIALSDAVVLPYREELGTYSVSGILHLSMGSFKPIVGTRVPRLIELYQFVPRLTSPPRTPSELAKKIRWLVGNYEYAIAYIAYLYGYAVRTSWIRMARRHISLYNELLRRGA